MLSLLWILPYCYWVNVGWCADFTPLILLLMVPPIWFAGGLVVFFVAWLLDKRAKPQAARLTRWLPFILMAVTLTYFLTSEYLRSCVIRAVNTDDNDKLTTCLNLGGSVDSLEYKFGSTALWIAVSKRNLKAVDILLSRGALISNYPPCSVYNVMHKLNVMQRLDASQPHPVDQEIRQKLIKAGANECPDEER